MMSFTGLNPRHEIELSRRCADSRDFYSSFNGCWRWGVGDAMLCAREEDFGGILVGFAMESQQKVKIEIGQRTLNDWHVCDEALNRLVVSNENGPDV
jgi:hypothetical protein